MKAELVNIVDLFPAHERVRVLHTQQRYSVAMEDVDALMEEYAVEVLGRTRATRWGRPDTALNALASGDPQQLIDTCRTHEISMCGMVPAALVMETLHKMGKSFEVVEVDYGTSGDVSGDKSQVVGYAGALFMEK